MSKVPRTPGSESDPLPSLKRLSIPGINPDNTIPHELLLDDLKVEVPDSEAISAGNYLQLYANKVPLTSPGARYEVTQDDKDLAAGDDSFRYPLSIAKINFEGGEGQLARVELDYFVGSASTGELSLMPVEFIIDREPPGGADIPRLSFTAEQQLDGITDQDLTGNTLSVPVPRWFGKDIGDTLTPWLGTSADQGSLLTESEVHVEDKLQVVAASFPKNRLLSNGNITQYFGYQLRDSFGNVSDVSRRQAIKVTLSEGHIGKEPRIQPSGGLSFSLLADAGLFDLPALLPPPETFADGTLPIALLNAPIRIRIPNVVPQFPGEATIYLYRQDASGTFVRIPGAEHVIDYDESDDPDFVFDLEVPLSLIPTTGTTPLVLEYQVDDENSGSNPFSGRPIRLIIDREPPGGTVATDLPQLEFTPDQLSGITLADVVGGNVPVQLPAWYLSAALDEVELWLGTSSAPGDGAYLPGTFTLPVAGNGITVNFPVAELEKLGNAKLHFGYRLKDKAGNVSVRSTTVAIDVLLSGAPSNLLAPIVPDFLDHGVITQKDAAELVEIEIPDFTNAQVGDRIDVIWGRTTLPGVYLTQGDLNPPAGTPLKVIKLPYALALSEGSGKSKQVTYQVWRGPLLADTSPPATVDVDLSSPGPGPDPDPGTPWHENLVPLRVTSRGGADNAIPPVDFNSPATATIPHLGKDGRVIWQSGDRVQVSWDGVLVGTPVPITTGNANNDIRITIPADVVSGSTGLKNVYYIVSRDLAGTSQVATAEAEPTEVDVQSPGLLPGDGSLVTVFLPEEHVSGNRINRLMPGTNPPVGPGGLDGTPIHVPLAGVTNITVGDQISLRLVGRRGLVAPPAGAGTLPELPGTEYVVNGYSISQQDIDRGYAVWNVPYNPNLQRICRNGATIDYSITNRVGQPVDAATKFVRIFLDQPGSIGVCPINPVP